jgi:hypothetical protein
MWYMVISCLKMHKTTLYLPTDLQQRLRDLARRTGRPQAELVRDALERYLAAAPTPRPICIGTGDDPDLDARDAKQWLHERWTGRER